MATQWASLIKEYSTLDTVQAAFVAAPKLGDMSQSVLHIWTALEALFPRVNSEVTFQVALYLTQLNRGEADRVGYLNKVRQAYRTRSKIAHGGGSAVSHTDWEVAWSLLRNACQSILDRGCLPGEDELLRELLSSPQTR